QPPVARSALPPGHHLPSVSLRALRSNDRGQSFWELQLRIAERPGERGAEQFYENAQYAQSERRRVDGSGRDGRHLEHPEVRPHRRPPARRQRLHWLARAQPRSRARLWFSQRSRAELDRRESENRLQLVLSQRTVAQLQRVAVLARLPRRSTDPRRLRRVSQQPAQRPARRCDRRHWTSRKQRAARLHRRGGADSRLAVVRE